MTTLNLTRDVTGAVTYSRYPAEYLQRRELDASTAYTYTVYGEHQVYNVLFSYTPGSSVFVKKNGTATLPTTTPDNDTSELNPSCWTIKQGETISFITADSNVAFTASHYNKG